MRLFQNGYVCLLYVCVFCVFFPAGMGHAKTFDELLSGIVESESRIIQAQLGYEISGNTLRSSYGEWLPAVDLSGHYGYEEIRNERSANTYFEARKFQAKLTQLLFNYSKIIGIKTAAKQREISRLSLKSIKQTITFEAVTAYFNLARAHQQLKYARISESNILTQAGKEKARVEKGSGVATNVLQINQQLYGARANRVRAERVYQNAVNNYKRVFKEPFEDPKSLVLPFVPYAQLPVSLEAFLQEVTENNISLKQSKLSWEHAKLANSSSTSEFLPEINIIGQSQFKEDDGGTEYGKDEHLIKLDFTYNIFNGGKDYYSKRNKILGIQSARLSLKNTSEIIEESARNSWENYVSSSKRARYLHNQAKTAEKFLEKAKTERKLGRRSLIDVLDGETNYINSISNAISSDTDMALAVYNMFFIMGKLDPEMVINYKPEKAQKKEGTPQSDMEN